MIGPLKSELDKNYLLQKEIASCDIEAKKT
jgi:hypothetical protein